MSKIAAATYTNLLKSISSLLENARHKAYYKVNEILLQTYWQTGKYIVEFEQKGKDKAQYGSKLLDTLARDLKIKYGNGFSRSNLQTMRLFYLKYQKRQAVPGKLSWTHYCELLKIETSFERSFYEQQCIKEKWSYRELRRQINSALFERLALSKNKKQLRVLSKKGQKIEKAEDIVKNEYCLEFLGLEQDKKYRETTLETSIINNLEKFLLELGKGFAFVKRQFRIHINNKHFFVDLVFYNMILKCYVLIDLKTKEVSHSDIGQMNMYLNYFNKEERLAGDNETVGIVLSTKKDDIEIEYALGGITNKIFASKYKLYLPNKKILKAEISKTLEAKGVSINKNNAIIP
jgi:predicted nuclease of restriction endonuclease-like (RecB) superfamily